MASTGAAAGIGPGAAEVFATASAKVFSRDRREALGKVGDSINAAGGNPGLHRNANPLNLTGSDC